MGNLSWDIEEDDLKKMFEPFGEIVSTKIVKMKKSHRSRGFGFVEFKTKDAAISAKQGLNGKDVKGRAIKVEIALESRRK